MMTLPETCDMSLSNGFFEIVKEPKNAKIISCSNHTPGNLTGNILFKDCFGTDEGQELSKEKFLTPIINPKSDENIFLRHVHVLLSAV